MLNLIPLLVGGHILDSKICTQIHDFYLGENLLIYQGSTETLGGRCENHIHPVCQGFHIIIHTFVVYDLKHVLVDFCILLIYVASGTVPFDLHVLVSCKNTNKLAACISGCTDNSCLYHFSVPFFYAIYVPILDLFFPYFKHFSVCMYFYTFILHILALLCIIRKYILIFIHISVDIFQNFCLHLIWK